MKTPILRVLACGLTIASTVTIVAAELPSDDLSPGEVQHALDVGRKFLISRQREHGNWSEYINEAPGSQVGGITALCTLALLNAGESPDEPHVKKALDYLRNLRSKLTYVVALQTMVFCRANKPQDAEMIAHNVALLQENQAKETLPEFKGGWSYGADAARADPSNSQYALLALYEARRAAETQHVKIDIDRSTWELARKYWIYNQRQEDGSWPYRRPLPGIGSMTCAGIASLLICDDVLREPDAKVSGDEIDACYREASEDRDKIEAGIKWLAKNFSVRHNPAWPQWHYYYLYGLERAGRLSSRRKIGDADWYREGAKYLVRQGLGTVLTRECWKGTGPAESNEEVATSMALMFLSKGRWPVLMAKVQYGERARSASHLNDKDIEWNRHRQDVANLTLKVEEAWSTKNQPMDLTWQIIDLDKASVNDLLQVKVIFFSGGGTPLPSSMTRRKELAEKLRDFVDRGGFIFADGEACSSDFDAGFRKLMELTFEKPEYRLKPLDGSHPIWKIDQKIPQDQPHLLLGIDYGCRTSVVYAPANPVAHPKPSLACLWELSRGGQYENYSRSVKEQIKGGVAIGINVLAYATNRELETKDIQPANPVAELPKDDHVRGKFTVAILQHPGGCDAAPRALANLMEQAAHDLHIRVETHPKLIGMQDPALFDYTVVFMHGRSAFRLLDGERQALREFVKRGGLLFADAICGNEAFAESFRREMGVIFPNNLLANIPPTDPIWTKEYGGSELKTVKRRDPLPAKPGEPMTSAIRDVPPELKGIRFGERYGVIFSEFDLSCALEKHDSMECRGYTREDAARIGLNVLWYATQR
jgi:hypothetical protein